MADARHTPPLHRRLLIIGLKLAVSLALLALLFTRTDTADVWEGARRASVPWLLAALGIYAVSTVASAWRWKLLLDAQHIPIAQRALLGSLLVAGFFNNFLPSNIGGDFVRVRDTAGPARSTTLATMIVLVDRGIGFLALFLVAASGATMAATAPAGTSAVPTPIWPGWLWLIFGAGLAGALPAVMAPLAFHRMLQPLRRLHNEWVGKRIDMLADALARFRSQPRSLAAAFLGAIAVQALFVTFYAAVVRALAIPITSWDLAVIVPLSLVVGMLPVSLNGFGVREAAFSLYFTRVGLPVHSAVLLSLLAEALLMACSLSGAVVYVARGRH